MFTAEGMVKKIVGAGSQYLAAYKDGDGKWLDGGQSYSLHVDPNVPVEDFWSVMVYDSETRSMIVNGQVPGRDSNAKLKTNTDGSVDLYFGPTAPEGTDPAPTSALQQRPQETEGGADSTVDLSWKCPLAMGRKSLIQLTTYTRLNSAAR